MKPPHLLATSGNLKVDYKPIGAWRVCEFRSVSDFSGNSSSSNITYRTPQETYAHSLCFFVFPYGFAPVKLACYLLALHYCDVIMGAMTSQIISPTSIYSIVYSGADQRKHQSSLSLAFVRGIHRWPVHSPHKGPVTRKMFPFDDVIMVSDFSGTLSFWM